MFRRERSGVASSPKEQDIVLSRRSAFCYCGVHDVEETQNAPRIVDSISIGRCEVLSCRSYYEFGGLQQVTQYFTLA